MKHLTRGFFLALLLVAITTPTVGQMPALKPLKGTPSPSEPKDPDHFVFIVAGDNRPPSEKDPQDDAVALSEQWIALPFTPKANSTVTQIQVAVGYISGTKQIIVGLYSDNAGTVGTALATATATQMPNFGACCKLVTVSLTATAVTAGTQYWIGVTSDDTNAPDFTGVFESSNTANTAGDVAQGGWFTFSNNWPAAAAKGTVP